LEVAIDNAITTLFPATNRLPNLKLTFGLFYAYELIANPTDLSKNLTCKLPVALYPDKAMSPSIGEDIALILEQWKKKNAPSMKKGEWVFSLILYSEMETMKHPLLSLDQVFYRIDKEAAK
jgi:hypothetical protein